MGHGKKPSLQRFQNGDKSQAAQERRRLVKTEAFQTGPVAALEVPSAARGCLSALDCVSTCVRVGFSLAAPFTFGTSRFTAGPCCALEGV